MTALSYLRANNQYLDVSHGVFENYNLHVHVPSGAVPKDGPSAGITLFTSCKHFLVGLTIGGINFKPSKSLS